MDGLSGDEMYRPEISKPLVKVVTSASSSPVSGTDQRRCDDKFIIEPSVIQMKTRKITHELDKLAWSHTNIGTFDQTLYNVYNFNPNIYSKN